MKYVECFEVDSNRKFTLLKRNAEKTLSFPDHFAMLLTFSGIPLRNKNKLGRKYTKWNINKTEGWKTFKPMT